MFSIYGPSGRVFQGTLEQLRQIHQVHATDRTRALEPLLRDGHDAAMREAIEHGASAHVSAPATAPRRSAIAHYVAQRHPTAPAWYALAASDVMHFPVLTVRQDSRIDAAWRRLVRHGRGQAPVINAAGILVGMVTRAELLQGVTLAPAKDAAQAWEVWRAQPVESVMLTPIPSIAPGTELRRVAGALLESRLPGLPVVTEEGRVSGFVSRSDVLRAALEDAALDAWS